MLLKDPLHWFPDPYFSTVLLALVLTVHFVDRLVPRAVGGSRSAPPVVVRDRFSFLIIQVLGLAAVAAAVAFRYRNWTVAPAAAQYAGLFLIAGGLALREWAIIRLGRFFSRTVEIETGHKLIVTGPYRWIRHPAYTGMIIIYLGMALAIGSWLGALLTLALMLAATSYRIRVEEQVLLETFGQVYRDYMQHTWRLLPGW